MTILAALVVLAVLGVAYSNGANDNFKGVATLLGSGTTTYRRALAWATATTLAGSLLALVLAHGLVETFRGKGLVPDAVVADPAFAAAVALSAALTVLLATRLGLPVSTTHALTGGLVGAGLVADPAELRLASLGSSFVAPLLVSPLLALALTLLLYPLFRLGRRAFGVTRTSCVCVGAEPTPAPAVAASSVAVAVAAPAVAVRTGVVEECVERYQGRVLGIEAGAALDTLHFLSGGAVGFARGLNDTPKIVALLLAGAALPANLGLVLVAVIMAVGGLLNARRVAETMSRRITRMNTGQGFTANLVTAGLVTLASRWGLPVSTTHVSVGALFGIGAVTGTARLRTVLSILTAWITTLPIAAALAALALLVLSWR